MNTLPNVLTLQKIKNYTYGSKKESSGSDIGAHIR